MIQRIPGPVDSRAAGVATLARLIPMPNDAEAREERRLLRRMDIREAVRGDR